PAIVIYMMATPINTMHSQPLDILDQLSLRAIPSKAQLIKLKASAYPEERTSSIAIEIIQYKIMVKKRIIYGIPLSLYFSKNDGNLFCKNGVNSIPPIAIKGICICIWILKMDSAR